MRYRIAILLAALLSGSSADAADILKGGGATFPYPLYQKWFAAFAKKSPETPIQYEALGSGPGVDALMKGELDFAGSDIPLTDQQLAALPGKAKMIPTVMGGVVPVYHLDGILDDVRFTPEALAGIYAGKITRWNDPVLKAANRGIALPGRNIVVVHRSDRSGTTFIWTSYLSQVSSEWKTTVGAGDAVRWPVGVAGEGNEGVSRIVAQTPDSIGYVEFIYALQNRLSYGFVRNRAGRFVQADLMSVPAAAADFGTSIQDDFRAPITDAPGRDSYPIASLTYLVAPVEIASPARRKAMGEFLIWMLTSGQKQCAALGYAALPPAIADKARHVVEEQWGGAGR